MPSFIRTVLPLVALSLVGCRATILSDQVTTQQELSQTFEVAGTPRIVCDTYNGNIDVFVVSEKSVQARITKRGSGSTFEAALEDLDNIDVQMTQDGDVIRILARRTDRSSGGNSGASAELEVPVGSILELASTNGAVKVTGRSGDTVVKTSNGSILVKEARARLRLHTTNGSIQVEEGRGPLELATSNGSIKVTGEEAVIQAQSTNGGIDFRGTLADDEQIFKTSNGRVTLALPPSAQFQIDAKTSQGKIRPEFTLTKKDAAGKGHLRGEVGQSPTCSIKIQTSNGSIDIKKDGKLDPTLKR